MQQGGGEPRRSEGDQKLYFQPKLLRAISTPPPPLPVAFSRLHPPAFTPRRARLNVEKNATGRGGAAEIRGRSKTIFSTRPFANHLHATSPPPCCIFSSSSPRLHTAS